MKKIKLSRGKFVLVDNNDFNYLNQNKWYCSTLGYAVRYETGKNHKIRRKLYMHRVILNVPDNMQIDHINRNKLDNRKINLRICKDFQNKANRLVQSNNKNSSLKGVYFTKSTKKWRARIQVNGIRYNLGEFLTKIDAFNAYKNKSIQFNGSFSPYYE